MPASYIQLGQFKIAPFKAPTTLPFGPFANITVADWPHPGKYAVHQSIDLSEGKTLFKWASSEQAYHAQKLIHLKNKLDLQDARQPLLTAALQQLENTRNQPGEVFLPQDYVYVVAHLLAKAGGALGTCKEEFDELCDANYHCQYNPKSGINPNSGEPYTLEFMTTVLQLKFEQHPELLELAMQCAQEGIIPIEISRFDNNWSSGPDGNGDNRLGCLILQLGNQFLRDRGLNEEIAITAPFEAYQLLRDQHSFYLRHDHLIDKMEAKSLPQTLNRP